MIARTDEKKAVHLDNALALISERTAAASKGELESFIRQYYSNVLAEDLLALTPANIYGAALAHYKLAATRRPGEALVRVYTPRIDTHGWHAPLSVIEMVNDDMPFLLDSVSAAISAAWAWHSSGGASGAARAAQRRRLLGRHCRQ